MHIRLVRCVGVRRRIIADFLIFIMTVVDFKAFFRRCASILLNIYYLCTPRLTPVLSCARISGAIQDRRRMSTAALARAQVTQPVSELAFLAHS
jgi:hypothetical protein